MPRLKLYSRTPQGNMILDEANGQPAERIVSKEILYAFRSKWAPHVGAKQIAKAAAKA